MKVLRLLPLLVLGFAGLTALAACDAGREDPVGGLSLTADGAAYATGASVEVTVRNDGAALAGTTGLYCALLERRTDDGWEASPEGNNRGCPQVEQALPPGAELAADIPLDGVGAGTYRFAQVVGVEGLEEGVTLRTAPFDVR